METDAQTQTRAVIDQGAPGLSAAGDLDIINACGLLSAIENPQEELQQLRNAPALSVDQVRVIPAQEVIEGADTEAITNTVADRQQDLASLREAIGDDPALSAALERAEVPLEDVIALDVIDEGAVLYTWSR